MLDAPHRSDRHSPPAWLGAVAMVANLGAALGRCSGRRYWSPWDGAHCFLANLPVVMAATPLLLCHFPADRAGMWRDAGSAARGRIVLQRQPFSVSARFAVACTVFFAAFLCPAPWLLQSSRLGGVETGAAMARW